MFSWIGRSGGCWIWAFASRHEKRNTDFQSRPSATSLTVKSNSLRQAKSTSGAAFRVASALTAALAPINPTFRAGLASLRAVIAFTSDAKDGVDVCTTARSKFFACAVTSASVVLWGGASMSLLSATSAAGCASQVGYQKDATSRFV